VPAGQVAAAILLIAGIARPLFLGEIYTEPDLRTFHLVFRFFYAEMLAGGQDFLWFPYEYNGFYLHGEGQLNLYHPLNWLLYRFFPLDIAFNLELIRNYVLLLWGTYLFARRSSMRRDAAMLIAITFAFSGFNVIHFVHLNVVAIVAHLPFQLAAIDDFRLHSAPLTITMRHVRLATGYVALAPVRHLDADLHAGSSRPVEALRVANIAYAYGERLESPLRRARLVAHLRASSDVTRDIGHIDPARVALVEPEATKALPPLSGEPGHALILTDRPGDILVETSAPAPQLFVLSESYHPGWRATIDATTPCEIIRVSGDFMGCVVPEGVHEVHLRFDPKSLRDGKRATLAAAALTIALYLAAIRRAPTPSASTSAATPSDHSA
jgi:hypothetical protein